MSARVVTPRTVRLVRASAISILLCTLVAGLVVFLYSAVWRPITVVQTPVTSPLIGAEATGMVWTAPPPVRLIIPAIGVDAAIEQVGIVEDGSGAMGVPSNFTDVGWYKYGVRPGMRGSAVIAGHYTGRGVPQAVFYDLSSLTVGDEVVVMSDEYISDIFVVVKVVAYDYDAPTAEVFSSTDGAVRLNLITCGGEWLPQERLYSKRTVVFTRLQTDVE